LKYKPNEYYKNEMKPKTTSETAPKSTSLSWPKKDIMIRKMTWIVEIDDEIERKEDLKRVS
jgi:hypothetical protein